MASERFKLDKDDVKKLATNALLVGGASALTYVVANIGSLDLGSTGLLLVPVITVALNSVIQWLKDNKQEDEKVDVVNE